jgi:nucleoside-diphosphate-sugar epimerase
MTHSKIVVTGGSGLVGKALKKYLPNAIYLSSKDFDLTTEDGVKSMYELYKPETVIHLAAKVGGILDNISKPAEYFTDNVLMNTLLVEYAYKSNIKRFIGILSTCIYPDAMETYPMKETDLHLGPPTITNFSYGYAKRSLAVQIDAYNQQYKTKYQYLTPCNLYGDDDKDNESNSHFITALVKKIYDANTNGEDHITLFGDGTPLRQFMYADDFAKVISQVIENDIFDNFNVATPENLSIKEMAEIALDACDSNHLEIIWDTSKPNGQFRKDVSIDLLKSNIPTFVPTPLHEGIKKIYTNLKNKGK